MKKFTLLVAIFLLLGVGMMLLLTPGAEQPQPGGEDLAMTSPDPNHAAADPSPAASPSEIPPFPDEVPPLPEKPVSPVVTGDEEEGDATESGSEADETDDAPDDDTPRASLPPFPEDIPAIPAAPGRPAAPETEPTDEPVEKPAAPLTSSDVEVKEKPVETQDLVSALFLDDMEAKTAYLTETQKQELTEGALAYPDTQNLQQKEEGRQEYQVEWADTSGFEELVPDIEWGSVNLYAVARAEETPVFEEVKRIAREFGIGGTTMRMSEADYATFDMASGDILMMYDYFKNTFQIPSLNTPLEGQETPELSLEWMLYDLGFLRFPYTAKWASTSDGGKVVRFEPALELPTVRFDSEPPEGGEERLVGSTESFPIGITEAVDARIDSKGNLTELYNYFPNLEKWDEVELLDRSEIAGLLAEGQFVLGEAELQYPGALTLDERLRFYNLADQDEVQITEGELSEVYCGYFQEPHDTYQLFYQPVCIAYGQGFIGDYAAQFGAVISIAE